MFEKILIGVLLIAVFSSTSIAFGETSQNGQKGFGIGKSLTLILFDSNLNFDSDRTETHSLDLIRFQSDNIRTTLGPKGGVQDAFNPQPSALRETGDNTGIFYTVIEIPRMVKGEKIDFGEKIEFEYTQRGTGAKLIAKPGSLSQDMLEQLGSTSKVSVKAKSFRFGQPVEVTLNDPDLNRNGDLIDIYTVVNNPKSPFVDTVGSTNGILLEIKIKDIRYQRCTIDGIQHGGLGATGFTLVETGPSTGIFKGIFKIPQQICDKTGSSLITSAGGNIKAIYHDFRDSFGQQNIQTN